MRIPTGSILIFPRHNNALKFYKSVTDVLGKTVIEKLGVILEPTYVVAHKFGTTTPIWMIVPPLAIILRETPEITENHGLRIICDNIGHCFNILRDAWGEVGFIRVDELSRLIMLFENAYRRVDTKMPSCEIFNKIRIVFYRINMRQNDYELLVITGLEKLNASGFMTRIGFLDERYIVAITKAMKDYGETIPIAVYVSDKESLPAVIVRRDNAIIVDVYVHERYLAKLFVIVLLTMLQLVHQKS